MPDVEAVGEAIGRELAPRDAPADADSLTATLNALGFQPTATEDGYCLGNCPYRQAVEQNPDVVCTLHRGMTRGLLEVLDPNRRLVTFVPHAPDIAGCGIELADAEPEPR
jgi:predicted ArsR family transcriptional regulator